MRYTMKQKWFGLLDDFYIRDDSGKDKFFVKSDKGVARNNFSFADMTGKEIFVIEERKAGKSYEIMRNDKIYAKVEELDGLIQKGFRVEIDNDTTIKIEGNIVSFEYTFSRDDKEVARVSKARMALTDTYGIEVNENENDTLVLACVVIIDVVYHSVKGNLYSR